MDFINFEFDPNSNFTPSNETKNWGMYTHKSKHTIAGMTIPGFYQTTNITFHLLGFFFVFILEGIAIVWSHEEGSSIAIILGLAIFDIFLAIMAHRNHANITIYRNLIIFTEGTDKLKYEDKLSSLINNRNFYYFLIIVSAMAKFYFFFSIYMFFDAVSLLILFLYLLVGILHISCTGYAIFSLIFLRKISVEHSKFKKSSGKKHYYDVQSPLNQPINLDGIKSLREVVVDRTHSIIKREEDDKVNFYFKTNGVLNDRQLNIMISNQQTDTEKRIIAVEGIKQQYLILNGSGASTNSTEANNNVSNPENISNSENNLNKN